MTWFGAQLNGWQYEWQQWYLLLLSPMNFFFILRASYSISKIKRNTKYLKWIRVELYIEMHGYRFSYILVFNNLMFYSFYNLALKKIRRRTYEHWCKIEALFISCKDQISIHYLQVMSDSFKWIWNTSLQLLTYVPRNNNLFIDLRETLWLYMI